MKRWTVILFLLVECTTVDSHKERIKGKFGFDTLVECVAHAVELGIVKAG